MNKFRLILSTNTTTVPHIVLLSCRMLDGWRKGWEKEMRKVTKWLLAILQYLLKQFLRCSFNNKWHVISNEFILIWAHYESEIFVLDVLGKNMKKSENMHQREVKWKEIRGLNSGSLTTEGLSFLKDSQNNWVLERDLVDRMWQLRSLNAILNGRDSALRDYWW